MSKWADCAAARLPGVGARTLAVFDLDGTLIKGDSFLPFLVTYACRRGRIWPLVLLPFYLALYACRVLSDRAAKERLIATFFGQESLDQIDAHAEHFCSRWVRKRLRDEVLTKLRQHQAAGDRVVLVSASPDLYVAHVAKYLGIAEWVCTRVSVENSLCAGTLAGPNCKGWDKVALLQRHLGTATPPDPSYAYGDSWNDLPLLQWVRHGILIKQGKAIALSGPSAEASGGGRNTGRWE